MGQLVQRETERDAWLNEKINADLRNKSQTTTQISNPDLAEDIDYGKDLKQTGRFSWMWIALIVLALISLVSIVLF